ncbi:zinc finger protein 729 [Papilio machaon]|uniref:zinc finger protein 729 n=1 Tax=Papilio machaon TaxID=76193 RepID=UPI001E6650AD|nr:zinc finger protein 729 [Papilio machaon]
MALKLGKCRLCLKLGDFYSIFTMDNNLQLAEMVMECARVKIYEGDGLPDKICSECIQKLSSAHIFKQQCERSDQELRRNYVPPPGYSAVPSPTNRQSSDSAFSNNTDVSVKTQATTSPTETKVSPASRSRKRSAESIDNTSSSGQSYEYRPTSTKRVAELRAAEKRPRRTLNSSNADSDYEDNSGSQCSVETDSDEPSKSEFKCKVCGKEFASQKGVSAHSKVHLRKSYKNVIVNIPQPVENSEVENANDIEDKMECEKCDKKFKLKIMLKRHQETCGKILPKSPIKELQVSLEPIDSVSSQNKIECEMCSNKFKTIDNLEKHMRVVHAAVLKRDKYEQIVENGANVAPCYFCAQPFEDYNVYIEHFDNCSKKRDVIIFTCPLCRKVLSKKSTYFLHIKNMHLSVCGEQNKSVDKSMEGSFECRICSKKMVSQDQLISHLAGHMSNMGDDEMAEVNTCESPTDNEADLANYSNPHVSSGPLKCSMCEKRFTYKKALVTHEQKHLDGELEIKQEPEEKDSSLLSESYRESESESSQEDDDDNTCDICEKEFSYKRLLIQHKKTKHNMSSGTKRAKISLKDCSVKCLICDIEMKVSAINEHNQKHTTINIKPRNLYTCAECNEKFKSCSSLATHIKLVHRLKQPQTPKLQRAELADFCEVVVTKTEPLASGQDRDDLVTVPSDPESAPLVNLSGFTCPTCGKQMPTLISLKRHINWHSNVGNNIEKKLECFVCKEVFRFQCHYRLHMRKHYNDTNLDPALLTCTICNRKSKHLRAAKAHMNFHKQTRFKNKDYQCSICKRVFQFRKVYLSHMAIHYKRGESANNTVVGIESAVAREPAAAHTCQYCGKVCDSEVSLKHHVIWHKSKTSLFGARHECNICGIMFTNKRTLELHVRSHYEDDNGPYKCTICGKGFIDEVYHRKHVKGHNFDHQSHQARIAKLRKDKVKCPICSRFYPDLVKLIRHLRRTHPESKMIKNDPDAPQQSYFSCKLCAKVFLDERRLQHHEEAHLRKPEFFKCKFCGKKTMSLKGHRLHIKSHLTQKYIDEPLKCMHCEETFTRGYDLHYHLRDVHDITETWIAERTEITLNGPLKEFQCSICLKILASKGNFERHIDYHNSLRCNYCFDYFSSLRFLEGHLTFSCDKKKLVGDTEVYPRKVKCHICYKAFHLQVKLDCHLRTQHNIKVCKEVSEGKKDFVCDYCFKVFENEFALSTHKVYHRTVGFYGCLYCNRKFNTLTVFKKHKNHHFSQLNVDNPTKCEHCDETFVAFREFIYHMRDVHGDDKEWTVLPKESIEEKCHICNKIFFNLHKHLAYHEENRCKKCSEYFYSQIEYDNHLCAIESEEEVDEKNESDLRPKYEECAFCFKPTTKKNSQRLHDHIHKVSGSISCRFCPLKFKTIDAFNIHAFSHRSRKYDKKPIKCRQCGEKFVRYGPFIRHMRAVHKSKQKLHYRAMVRPEPCVVCGDLFPNLHNHYRAHLQNQCQQCRKYFTSCKVFSQHECDKEDSNPSKVFTCDENLLALINSYTPKDEKDDEKFYGHSDDEDEMAVEPNVPHNDYMTQDEESQNSTDMSIHQMVHAPIISDVLSLYKQKEEETLNVVDLVDDNSLDGEDIVNIITIDD